ncbi:MAG: MerR family transcriptional regulator [Dehalococcoidia bacterium]|nr:MerR family transcriptional regulator [Dehalococcoidia bacterium]
MVGNNGNLGVYVMQVASMLTGLHPQTLRKYERAGFLMPSRRFTVRLYSDEDIARLKMIKYLVEGLGLNLAGVELVLKLRDRLLELKEEIASAEVDDGLEVRLLSLLDDMLDMIGSY